MCRHSCCGYDINAKDPDFYNRAPLHGAAIMGHKRTAAYLIRKSANVNALDDYGLTPLDLTMVKTDPYYELVYRPNNAYPMAFQYSELRSDRGRSAINMMLLLISDNNRYCAYYTPQPYTSCGPRIR
jgi:ankyrin repeat protein